MKDVPTLIDKTLEVLAKTADSLPRELQITFANKILDKEYMHNTEDQYVDIALIDGRYKRYDMSYIDLEMSENGSAPIEFYLVRDYPGILNTNLGRLGNPYNRLTTQEYIRHNNLDVSILNFEGMFKGRPSDSSDFGDSGDSKNAANTKNTPNAANTKKYDIHVKYIAKSLTHNISWATVSVAIKDIVERYKVHYIKIIRVSRDCWVTNSGCIVSHHPFNKPATSIMEWNKPLYYTF